MSFISSGSTCNDLDLFYTQLGRKYLILGDGNETDNVNNKTLITSFSVADTDVNYQNQLLISKGNLPRISGDIGCIVSISGSLSHTPTIPITNIEEPVIPVLRISPSSINFGTFSGTAPTPVSSYVISGTGISTNIEIRPPAGVSVSLNPSSGFITFPNILVLEPVAQSVSPTTIYIFMTRTVGGVNNKFTVHRTANLLDTLLFSSVIYEVQTLGPPQNLFAEA